MRPKLNILGDELVEQIIAEGFELLMDPGVRVHNAEALRLLAEAGAASAHGHDDRSHTAGVGTKGARDAPIRVLSLRSGRRAVVHYGGDSVQFDPGSAAITILDSETQEQRVPVTADFVKFVKLVEMIPQLDAQSTAMICVDVPEEVGDLYRLYLALNYMRKPIITGAFRKDTWWTMKDMLVAMVGSEEALAAKPIAVFDVCPSPPLLWSDLTCQNMIDCGALWHPVGAGLDAARGRHGAGHPGGRGCPAHGRVHERRDHLPIGAGGCAHRVGRLAGCL